MEEEQPTPKKPEKASISAKLEALGSDKKRPQTALVAENLESIERAIERGIPAISIWKALQEEGITLTFRSFESALYRLRKKKAPQRPETQVSTHSTAQRNPASVGGAPLSTPSEIKPLDIPGNKNTGVDEELKAFKESIKHLSDREKGKKLFEYIKNRADKKSF